MRRIYSGRAVIDMRFGQMTAVQARDYVHEAHAGGRASPRTLYVLGMDVDGDLVGIIRLRITGGVGRLAYILREDAWGYGHATAAVRLLPVGDTVTRITAEHRTGNPASGRVLVKAGFVQTGATGELVRYERVSRHRM